MEGLTVRESGLDFHFPPGWTVRKYDDHNFYKGLSSAGLKAVDFIVLTADGQVWLIEVKNYLSRSRQGKTYHARVKASKRLATAVHRKFEDSLHAIRVINRYYERKWWYRLLRHLPRGWRTWQADHGFWAETYDRISNGHPPRLLIWLELEERRKNYRTRFYATLRQLLAGESVELYMGFDNHNPLPGMEVRRAEKA